MKTPPISLDRPALGATVKGYAKMMNQIAVESKEFALSLMEEGLRTDVTPSFLRNELPDVFTKNGKLKSKARQQLAISLKKYNLPQNTTLKELKDFFIESLQKRNTRKAFREAPDSYFDSLYEKNQQRTFA